MSDESHALSRVPPSPPAEDSNYDAIHAAVMETARGRWFLQEYAKRNRNADTGLVLAAIERMEAVIRDGSGLQEAAGLHGFRGELLDMARAIARTRSEIPDFRQAKLDPSLEDSTATAPGGAGSGPALALPPDIFAAARRIREVAWTLRERGVEISTCDQIAALASSILGVSSLRNASDSRAQKLSDVLQHLERRIHAMLHGDGADAAPPDAPAMAADVPSVQAAAAEETEVAAAETELPPETASIETRADSELKVAREPSSETLPAAAEHTAAAEEAQAPTPVAAGIEPASATSAEPVVGTPIEAISDGQGAAPEEIDASLGAPAEAAQPADHPSGVAVEPEKALKEEASAEPVVIELEPLVVVPVGAGAHFVAEPVELELTPVAIIPPAPCRDEGPEPEPLLTTQIEWGSPAAAAPAAAVRLQLTGQMDLEPSPGAAALADGRAKESAAADDIEGEMLALARAALPEPGPVSPTSAACPSQAGEDTPDANPALRKAPSDRLAAIRAISENERIALFS